MSTYLSASIVMLTISQSSSVRSITSPSLTDGGPLSRGVVLRSRQPLTARGLGLTGEHRTGLEDWNTGSGPTKNFDRDTDDRPKRSITSSCNKCEKHRISSRSRLQFSAMDWIVQCFTSPPTQYRLYGRRFLQVKRPNQQYQSTEGDATKEKAKNENN